MSLRSFRILQNCTCSVCIDVIVARPVHSGIVKVTGIGCHIFVTKDGSKGKQDALMYYTYVRIRHMQ